MLRITSVLRIRNVQASRRTFFSTQHLHCPSGHLQSPQLHEQGPDHRQIFPSEVEQQYIPILKKVGEI